MTEGTQALVERLREAADAPGPCADFDMLREAADAIDALAHPLPVAVDGCEPSDYAIARAIREWFWVEDDEGSEELEKASNESGRLIESSVSTMKSVLRLAYRIDVAPRLAAEYGRGVDDAREKATDHGKSHE